MSHYKDIIFEAVRIEGAKRILKEVLCAANVIDKDTVGQVVIHVNNGGITDVYRNIKVK